MAANSKKLEVGTKVRVLHTDYAEIPVGTVTHVVQHGDEDASLWCKEYPEGLFFFGHEFEVIADNATNAAPKFAVGDKVRVTKASRDAKSGHGARLSEEHTITRVFDDGVDTKVWYFYFDEIEPVAVAPQQQPLTVRAGAYYRTSDGRKVGPMRRSSHDEEYWWTHDDANFWHPEGRVFLTQDHPDDFIAEWTDEPAATNADIFDELEDWMADNPLPEIKSTTGFTVPLDAPEFGGGARFKVGDRVHYKDAYCEGVGVIHSDNDAANGYGWFVTVEEKDCDHASFNDNTTRIFTEDKLRLVAEATSGKDTINRVPWVKQAEENVSTIADIVRRLEALEAKQPAAPEHNIGDRVILSATVTGINKGRVNVVLDGVPSPGCSLAVPAASLRAA